MRKFHYVDSSQWMHPADIKQPLPCRSTTKSAGYDFRSPVDIWINPGDKVLIWTDIKAQMEDDEYLDLNIRSSLAIKKNLVLKNVVGIIDADYFSNSDNDGNIGICLKNTGTDPVQVKQGEKIAQGIFKKYLTTIDDEPGGERTGGIGSTGN